MTAENAVRRPRRPAGAGASMRPRPMTAENAILTGNTTGQVHDASMRPRPMTAENGRGG